MDGDDFGAQKLHAEDIGRLPLHVLCAHVDHARQAEARADGRGRNAVLARAGLGDDAGLAHPFCEQDLPDAVVDLVRAGVIELIALEPDLRAAKRLSEPLREVKRGGPTDIMLHQVVEFGSERRVGLRRTIFALQIEDQRHQRLGDIAAAELAEMPALIRHLPETIGIGLCAE